LKGKEEELPLLYFPAMSEGKGVKWELALWLEKGRRRDLSRFQEKGGEENHF